MIIFYNILYSCVFVYFCISIYRNPSKPTPYIVFFFSLYYFSSVLGERVLLYKDGFELQWIFYYLTVVFALALGDFLSRRLNVGLDISLSRKVAVKGVKLGLILAFPGFIYYFFGIAFYLFKNPGAIYGELWTVTRALVFFGNPALIFGLALIVYYFLTRKSVVLIGILPILLILFLTGERGDIAMLVFAYIPVAFHGVRKKIWFPVCLITIFAAAGIYGNVRAQITHGPVFFTKTICLKIIEEPKIIFMSFDINEFVNISTVSKAAMYDELSIEDPGMNIVRGIIKLVPILGRYVSSAYGTTGELVRDEYFDDLFELGVVTGSGALLIYGFDLYLAGGFIALFAGVFFVSYYINRLYISYVRGHLFFQMLYIVSFPLIVLQSQRSGFESLLGYLVKHHYFIIACVLIVKFLHMTKKSYVVGQKG